VCPTYSVPEPARGMRAGTDASVVPL